MLTEFISNIDKNALFTNKDKLLLAISGGIDSVVLAHLLKEGQYNFSLAHCNFQLRGKDSAADEKFCIGLAKKLNVPVFVQRFDTQKYCEQTGMNVQLAARKLRYDWFHELLEKHQFRNLLTAHHTNDLIETVFINLLRGTGINGLKGIPEKNGVLVRPLLRFSRSSIEAYAKSRKLRWREDKSNTEEKYYRNFIRKNIVPALKKLNPHLEETFLRNSFHLNQEAGIVKEFLSNKEVEYTTRTHDALFINKNRLKHERYIDSILHHLIQGYGFNGSQQKSIIKCITGGNSVGKKFLTATHELSIDRSDLVIKPASREDPELFIKSMTELKKIAFLRVTPVKKFIQPSSGELLVHPSKLKFPLTIRGKKNGDKFRPFGMKGSKLLSDYMRGEKMNSFDKENCSLLVNGNGEIIWIIGHRSDDRYRVDPAETGLIKIGVID